MIRSFAIGRLAPLAAAIFFVAAGVSHAAETPNANDTARILAGLAPSAQSSLASLARDPSWQGHAKFFDGAWNRLEERQLSKIRAWSAKNLTDSRPVVFYMFSGPDFLYADTFFDNASTYVLSGLEPVGDIPDLATLPRGSLGRELREIETSLNAVLNYSFFITRKMKTELRTGRLTGTLPLLYVFLARSGKTIDEVSLVELNPDGTVTPKAATPPKGASQGVKITFSGAKAGKQTLYYFSTDLSDGGIQNSGFLTFCNGLGPGDSLVKSASYLMHSNSFSKVREFLLTKSEVLVEDDSGIPVRYFDTAKWELRTFGRYLGPISIFPGRYQAELKGLYGKGSTPLDFGIGYRYRPLESNLLMAVKAGAKSASGEH